MSSTPSVFGIPAIKRNVFVMNGSVYIDGVGEARKGYYRSSPQDISHICGAQGYGIGDKDHCNACDGDKSNFDTLREALSELEKSGVL